jgi:hypothetical protein
MSGLAGVKARLREQAEHHLTVDAARRLRAGAPGTVDPYRDGGDRFWRLVFVPLYRRVPWGLKQTAMSAAKMTARGWTPPAREPGEPWRPPVPPS